MTRLVSQLGCGICLIAFALFATPAPSHAQNLERRVTRLEQQVSVLTQQNATQANQIASLQTQLNDLFQPQTINVDCNVPGQSVNAVLAQHQGRSALLTIRITGTCIESVNVTRDDVTLTGNTQADGVQSPGPESAIVGSGQRIRVNNMTVRGGIGLSAIGSGSVSGDNLIIRDATTGLNSTFFADLSVSNSTIENCNTGALVGRGATLTARTTTFRNNPNDTISAIGGRIQLQPGVVIEGSNAGAAIRASNSVIGLVGTTIRNHSQGIVLQGSSLSGTGTIENNVADGINASGGATVSYGGSVSNNRGYGIWLGDVSVLTGAATTTVTGNGLRGIECAGPPAVAQITAGGFNGYSVDPNNVSGNTTGQINCPGVIVP